MKKPLLLFLFLLVVGAGLVAWVVYQKTDTAVTVGEVAGVPLIEISGTLDGAGARKIVQALQKAEGNRPAMILVSFDSPGGEIGGTVSVADVLAGLSVPVVGWVKESLGGTVLLMAAVDRLYFSPTGVCGGAAIAMPSAGAGEDPAVKKLQGYLATKIRAWSKTKGHDPERRAEGAASRRGQCDFR